MKMWSGRFRQPLDPDFERWQRSFSFDRRLLKCELLASNAHARALKDAGILSSDELISILQGLKQIGEKAATSPEFLDDEDAEDVHHFVEKELVALIGETRIQAAQRAQPQRADCDRPATLCESDDRPTAA